MLLGFSSLKPLWSRLRRSRSSESNPQARAGSRTAKPLTLNTIAAAAVSEDSLPFAEPKSPRGAPKQSTNLPFHVHQRGDKVENASISGKSSKKPTKDKHKNVGSNDRANSLVPPTPTPGKGVKSGNPSASNTPTSSPPTSPETNKVNLASGNKSRGPSASNTPTSSPQTSPETKKEDLSRVVDDVSRMVKDGSTDTGTRERSGKQSTNTSPDTSPPKPQPSSPQGSSPPQARKPIPQPTGEPNTTTAVVEVGPANKTLGPSSSENAARAGLQDKQDNVKSTALPSPDTTTQAALEGDPANKTAGPSLSENATGSEELKDKSAALPSSDTTIPV